MTIDLASDVEMFLRQRLGAGDSTEANALVNDLLRSMRDLQQECVEYTPELEEWLLQAADSPVTPLTSADFEAIRARVRARSSSAE